MIRLSLGTAARLGLIRMRADEQPSAAYLLLGESCRRNCAFCPQARGAGRQAGRLGRVTWPAFPEEQVLAALRRIKQGPWQRICLQALSDPGITGAVVALARRLKRAVPLPLSLSVPVRSTGEAAAYFEAGAERLSIALDAATKELHARYKGGKLQAQLRLLLGCARLWPGRMSTHLICGLGETEEEAAALLNLLLQKGITVALFAFTPLKGTALEGHPPPDPASYRRLQALHYLMRRGHVSLGDLRFRRGRLTYFGIDSGSLKDLLEGGEAFQTSGCPGCNRPFYNEKPGGFIYNYPRRLGPTEVAAALGLVLGCGEHSAGQDLRIGEVKSRLW